MKTGLIAFGILLMGAVTALALSNYIDPFTWRYKITVEVDTPEGIRSGSAVREVSVLRQPQISPHVHTSVNVRGEAVVIDLGAKGKLFALIDWDSYYEVFKAFPLEGGGETTVEGLKYYSSLEPGKKAILPRAEWPRIVAFEDLNDPFTVKLVLGKKLNIETQQPIIVNNFEEIFGQDVNLKNVIIETTDEPITFGVEGILPWLVKIRGGYLHGEATSRGAPIGLYGGNFERGKQ